MSYYWKYEQNNSGGEFIEPAINLWVYASTEKEADKIAKENGVYWNIFADCECCGPRWSAADCFADPIPDYQWKVSEWEEEMAKKDGIPARLLIKGEQK